ncbi:MAG: hypothetical protein NVS9B4_23620 [Candidatus Acidiferrum sp.]
MRSITALLTLFSLLFCQKLGAQTEPPLAPGAKAEGPQQPVQQFYVEDGGVSEVLESIVIPPKLEAPFSLLLETESVRALADGGTITTVNKRRIARDGAGRVYQERWYLVPKNGKQKSAMTTIQIADPNLHTFYNCFMLDPQKPCTLSTYSPAPNAIYQFQGPPPGPLPNDMGYVTREDLGKQFFEAVETTGMRSSVNYNPGVFGNDRKMTIEREFWYSAKLGINLLSRRSDPRIGTQTFRVTNLILSEPDPKLFELPAGFNVVDQRSAAQYK